LVLRQNDSIWINIYPWVMIVEVHHAIVSKLCLSVTSMRPTGAGATDKTVLFHYNHVGTGIMSLKVLRMQVLLLEYLPDDHIRLFCNCISLHAGLRMFALSSRFVSAGCCVWSAPCLLLSPATWSEVSLTPEVLISVRKGFYMDL
jgi:hypothetical protein